MSFYPIDLEENTSILNQIDYWHQKLLNQHASLLTNFPINFQINVWNTT